ncbi:chemotaxis protein [Malaciobacter halophilus]|uniref:Chemotaxis protein n=1 Tax=Malaciobacter halophilus TaxID=197482 RepID=A0A2N1J3G1_9BACT|nr:methyl-accepting chemotaxis protein [Malaciobacter halophilus]AXH09098.1 Cache sensor-containing MCP-domain signal transduction protein [Malaciobacter halophilus]PKI81105.1 chemotaxis protein [Malaciobacter halophilus]
MKTNSIKTKLLFFILVSVSFSFLVLGIYSTTNEYKSQFTSIKQKELELVKQSSKFISSFLQSKVDIVEAVAQEIEKSTLDITNKELVEKLLLGKKSGNFVDLYIGLQSTGELVLSDGKVLNKVNNNYDARVRPWYKDAVSKNSSGVSKPYVDVSTKKLVVTVYTPYVRDGELLGVVGSDIFIDTIVETILNVELKKTGFAYLLDEEGNIIIHKDKKLLEKKSTVFNQIKTSNTIDFGEATIAEKEFLAAYNTVDLTKWHLIIQLNKDEIFQEIYSSIVKEIILYLVLLAIILAILFFTLIKFLSPIKTLEDGLNFFFKYLKGEEKEIKELNINTNDEFGNMAKVIDIEMKQVAKSFDEDKVLIEEVKKVVNYINKGKLDVLVKTSTSNKSLNELKDILNEMIETINANVNSDINPILNVLEEYAQLNFVNMIDNPDGKVSKGLNDLCEIINEMLRENKQNGINLDQSSKTLLHNVDILNKASNDTAVSLEETAAAVEEITSTIINNTNRITDMSKHSQELTQSIQKGNSLANSTAKSMDEINEQTKAIAEAILVIDQIAFQTNILSLNAAVEAATAGEAGKGFAVVAAEVRNLASRSAEAANQIKTIVENATLKANEGKAIAGDMIEGYNSLNENISKTTEAITDISDASREQKTSIEQINDVITRLDQQTQNNASVASQTHDIATNTARVAKQILDTVNQKQFRDS